MGMFISDSPMNGNKTSNQINDLQETFSIKSESNVLFLASDDTALNISS